MDTNNTVIEEKINTEDRLFHYTDFDSLIKIINSKTFKFNRSDKLNDKNEYMINEVLFDDFSEIKRYFKDYKYEEYESSLKEHSRFYSFSMTYSPYESISMWKMYGKQENLKIRIDFPRDIFEGLFRENNLYSEAGSKIINGKPLFDVKSICILDKIDYIKVDTEKELLMKKIVDKYGFIKYEAWKYEEEERALVKLKRNDKAIFLKLNEEFIKRIHVTFNPWISKEFYEILKQYLDKYEIESSCSSYHNKVIL